MNRIFLFLILTLLFSCKKEKDLLLDKTWILRDGKVYVEELDSGTKKYYDHFAVGKDTSSLNLDGALSKADSLIKNKTQWAFYDNSFILNNKHTFEATYNSGTVRVFPLNGSAMIVVIQKVTESQLVVKVGETFESINGVNVTYFSILDFGL